MNPINSTNVTKPIESNKPTGPSDLELVLVIKQLVLQSTFINLF